MRFARLAVLLSAGGLGACSLLLGTDLTGGSEPPATEAGVDAPSTTDAGVDAPIGSDAATDATDAARPSPCNDTKHDFCADFDGTDPFAGWTNTQSDGTLGVSPNALSAPFSMRATLPRRETTFGRSQLYVKFSRAWAKTTVEWDMFMEPALFKTGDINVGILCFNFTVGTGAGGACLARSGADTSFLQGGAAFPTGQWLHAKVIMDPFAATGSASVGDITMSGTFTMPTGATQPAIEVELGVLGYNKPSPAIDIRFDNVTVDFD